MGWDVTSGSIFFTEEQRTAVQNMQTVLTLLSAA